MSNPKIFLSELNVFGNIKKKEELSEQIKYLEGIQNSDNSYRKQVDELKDRYALIKRFDVYVINNLMNADRIEKLGEYNYIGTVDFDGNDFKI